MLRSAVHKSFQASSTMLTLLYVRPISIIQSNHSQFMLASV